MGCDGDSVSITAATQPSVEDVLLGAIPGLPKVHLHNPVLAYEIGDDFLKYWYLAEQGKLDPFVLVVEGSIPNEKIKKEGYWAALGTDPNTGQPITTSEWIDRLAPKAIAVIGAGTCATYGGIHAMAGQPDRLHGPGRLPRLGLALEGRAPDRQRARLSGAAGQLHGDGALPALPGGRAGADDSAGRRLRPDWLFGKTVHEGCDRAGYYEQGDFANEYGSPKCIVKLGCWGPVVNCNVPKRGWMAGIGGCPNVGGICIGCTMPGFPDKFMPFMDEPPGGKVSTAAVGVYGRAVRALRSFTNSTVNKEPKWRHPRRGADHRLSRQDLLRRTRGAQDIDEHNHRADNRHSRENPRKLWSR